ncbi:MAG TPA: hypothetical protein VL990_02835 [Acidobacteriaceae bacterium]|nr:hypothetical protein [Acidobacteriaceae bacterium]
MLLLRFEETDVGAGFGIGGVRFKDALPGGFGLNDLALLFESDSGAALLGVRGGRLGGSGSAGEGENGGEQRWW